MQWKIGYYSKVCDEEECQHCREKERALREKAKEGENGETEKREGWNSKKLGLLFWVWEI